MQPPSSLLFPVPLLASLLSLLPHPCAPDILHHTSSNPTSLESLEAPSSSYESSSEHSYDNPFNPNQPNFPFISPPPPDILENPSPTASRLGSGSIPSSIYPPPYSDSDIYAAATSNTSNNNDNLNNHKINITKDYENTYYNEVLPHLYRDYASLQDHLETGGYAFGDKVAEDDLFYGDDYEESSSSNINLMSDNGEVAEEKDLVDYNHNPSNDDIYDMDYESSRQLATHVLALDLGYHIHQGALLSHPRDQIHEHFMGSGKFHSWTWKFFKTLTFL